jgi:tetraacyldisaccharide 4'-kinase
VISRESLQADVLVTVGDIIPFIFACLWGNHKKIVHIGTAISAYIRSYSLLEMYLFRKYAACVVCRDQKTADQLIANGVNAVYYGNPMMDDPLLKKTEVKLGLDVRKKHIVLIPSSREDAYDNTVRMLSIIKRIGKKPSYSFCISLAPNLNLSVLARTCAESEWQLTDLTARKKPIVAELTASEANPVTVVRGYFRDCLNEATAIFGMTGTGNEQIAGLGIPIILLQGKSEAASRSRMIHYRKLLGAAVFVPHGSEQKIVEQIVEVLEDQRKLNRMAETGKQRMGVSGGAYHIARKIYYYIFQR